MQAENYGVIERQRERGDNRKKVPKKVEGRGPFNLYFTLT